MTNSTKLSESISSQEALAREFEQWQKLFYDDVHIHFSKRNVPRGEVALDSWEVRFKKFLDEQLPELSKKYRQLRLKNKLLTGNFVPPHYLDGFMRQVGDAITSFLEQCIDDARKGYLDEYRKKSTLKIGLKQPKGAMGKVWKSFFYFPKPIGYFFLDILNRSRAKDSTAIILGWIFLIIVILLLAKVVPLSLFEPAWGFFFPTK